jgi:hypothetical protein
MRGYDETSPSDIPASCCGRCGPIGVANCSRAELAVWSHKNCRAVPSRRLHGRYCSACPAGPATTAGRDRRYRKSQHFSSAFLSGSGLPARVPRRPERRLRLIEAIDQASVWRMTRRGGSRRRRLVERALARVWWTRRLRMKSLGLARQLGPTRRAQRARRKPWAKLEVTRGGCGFGEQAAMGGLSLSRFVPTRLAGGCADWFWLGPFPDWFQMEVPL